MVLSTGNIALYFKNINHILYASYVRENTIVHDVTNQGYCVRENTPVSDAGNEVIANS